MQRGNRNNRNNRRQQDFDEDRWDGIDRRGETDRRIPLPPHQYYPHLPQPPAQPETVHAVSQTTLTLKELGTLVVVILGIATTLFSGWNDLNRSIANQQNNLEQFKEQVSTNLQNLKITVEETKKLSDKSTETTSKAITSIDAHIQELDTSVQQLYQKVRDKNQTSN